MSFPIQLSMENSPTNEFILRLKATALRMEVSGQRMVVVVWILVGLLIVSLVVVLIILKQFAASRSE